MPTTDPSDGSLDDLYGRYRKHRDLDALGALFDTAAPRLQGLARRLARRRSEADDWVQETFLTVLEKPQNYPGSDVMPWMIGILVNHARADRRRSGREPEQDRLHQPEVPEPDAHASAAEVRSAIEGAIADLPPVQRQAVMARLLDGRSSAELGRDLGLAPGAVRARLHRGLERLRSVLPAGLATGLFAWLSSSRGLASVRARVLEQAARGGSAAGVPAAATAAGAAVLTKKLAAGTIGIALAAILALTLRELLTPPQAAGTEALAPTIDLAAQEGAAVRPRAAGELRAPVESAAATPGNSVALVSVIEENGDPAPGQTVILRAGRGSSRQTLEETTDEDGRARFVLDPNTYVALLELPIEPTRPLIRETYYRPIPAGRTQQFTLQIEPGFSIAGHVVDGEGKRLAGAEVLGWCGGGRTDDPVRRVIAGDDGSFRLDHLGPEVRMLARVEGMACLLGLRGAPEGLDSAEGFELVMAPALETRGQVTLPDGRPAGGVKVWVEDGTSSRSELDATHVRGLLTYRATSAEDMTDAAGSFLLDGLTKGEASAAVRLVPYLEKHHRIVVGAQNAKIALDAGETVSGQVFTPAGAPAAGASVRWGPYYSNRHHAPEVVTCDELGRYTIRGMSASSTKRPWVGVSHEGHALALLQPIELGTVQPDIHLEPEAPIAGVVVDEDGRPIPGVLLQCRGSRQLSNTHIDGRFESLEYVFERDEVRTNERGAFRFDRLYAGEFEVLAFASDGRRSWVSVRAPAGTQDLRIELSPRALERVVIRGKVLDAATGKPLPHFRVTPFIDGMGSRTDVHDEEGEFRIQGLDPGPIQVSIEADGYAKSDLPSKNLAIGEHEYQVQLQPGRSLHLSVVHADGRPFQGAEARFQEEDIRWRTMFGWSGGTKQISAEGFLFEDLPARVLNLEVEVDGTTQVTRLDLREDRAHRLEVSLQRPQRFQIDIQVFEGDTSTFDSTWIRAFEIALQAGDREWFATQYKEGHLREPRHPFELTLAPTSGSSRVRLMGESTPVGSEFDVKVTTTVGSMGMTSEEKMPYCLIDGSLPGGDYTLRATSKGYQPIEQLFLLDRDYSNPPHILIVRPR